MFVCLFPKVNSVTNLILEISLKVSIPESPSYDGDDDDDDDPPVVSQLEISIIAEKTSNNF